MEWKRYTSALLGFPIVLLILLIRNKYVVDIAFTIIALLTMHEYLGAVKHKCNPVSWLGYLSCISIAIIHILPQEFIHISVILALPIILLILFLQIIITNMKTNFKDIVYTFFGIAYVIFPIMCIALINGVNNGNILIWYAIIAAWGTDIFAYFTGKAIGKHKFSKVSPKKSIEGCIGGTIGAVLLILIYTYIANKFWGMEISYYIIALIGTVLSIIGQIGDFAASSIKRYVEIKDFSNMIPGHGGMLDRIDSLIFIAPFAYALLMLI